MARIGRRGLGLAALLVVALWPTRSRADGITASVDRTEAAMGEQFLLTVTVQGSKSAEPELPPLPMFEVESRGRSTQVQIVNGRISTAGAYTYALSPQRTGTFNIGPCQVDIDGRKHASQGFSVTVSAAPSGPQDGGTLFTTAEVSTQTPFVGQQVVYTWRFYRRIRVAGANLSPLEFPHLEVEPLGDRREFSTTLRGQTYDVTEIRKALFATEPGNVTLPATTLQAEVFVGGSKTRHPFDTMLGGPFDDFFAHGQRQTRTLRTTPIELKLAPLPPAPGGFTAYVGHYTVDARLGQSTVQVGESTTLTVVVRGTGNPHRMVEPALGSLPGFKVYDDKPVTTVNNQGSALTSERVLRKALVPLEPGQLTLPAISLTYFDPTAHLFRVAAAAPLTLHVVGSGSVASNRPVQSEALPPAKADVQLLGDDLLPIYKRADALTQRRFNQLDEMAWSLVLAVPPAIFVALTLLRRYRERMGDHAAARWRRGALRRALQEAAAVQRALKTGQPADAAAQASRNLREYLGAKLGLEGLALTAGEAATQVAAHGAPQPLAVQVEDWLSRCEAAQYGGSTDASLGALPTEMRTLLTQLDRSLRP